MSKKKNYDREIDQLQRLKFENKKLKNEIKALNKRLRQYEKREHYLEDKELDDSCEDVIVRKEHCVECAKGFMIEVNILDRIFKKCDTCGFRTRARMVNSGSKV